MSLNRAEEALRHYFRSHPDEQRHWHARVLALANATAPSETRAGTLARELRAYAAERATADAALGEAFGAGSVSLRNLAELLLATWPPPRPRRSSSQRPD